MSINYFSEASATFKTVRDCLRFAVSRFNEGGLFFGHGSASAYDEAAYLILHTLHLPLDRLEPFFDAALTHGELYEVLNIIEKRVEQRIPAAYLTHEAWLGDFRFYVDERVIVPRSFIAELLRERLAPWLVRPARIRNALDLGTGSGCLAVLLAKTFPDTRIDATDISRAALAVARRNVTDHRLRRRIRLRNSDMFAALRDKHYDLIVSNPPYVDAAAMRKLPREYRREPRLALAGGPDGFDFVRILLRNAARYLTPHGMLVVEIGHRRKQLEAAFPRLPFIWPQTSAGDDCVFILECRDLTAESPPPATRASVRPPRSRARGSGRA